MASYQAEIYIKLYTWDKQAENLKLKSKKTKKTNTQKRQTTK